MRREGGEGIVIQRAEGRGGAVGQDDVERVDMVDGLAVAQRACTGGVVADHAAEGGPVAGGDVGAEHQAEGFQVGVELVEDDAGLDPDEAAVAVDDADAVEVLGNVQHNAGADGLTGEARGRASGDDGDAQIGGDADHLGDIGRGARAGPPRGARSHRGWRRWNRDGVSRRRTGPRRWSPAGCGPRGGGAGWRQRAWSG